MRLIYYLAVSVLVCVASCTSEQKTHSRLSVAAVEEVESCLIPLDSVTTQIAADMHMINDSTLAFFNMPSRDICVVNLNTMTTEKVKIQKDGPNAIPMVDAFCYVSPDSIWLYEAWGKRMTLINSQGEVRNKLQLPKTNKDGSLPQYAVSPYATTATPYLVKGQTHILQGMGGIAEEGQLFGVTAIYDSEKDSLITGNPYPEVYGDLKDMVNNWSTFGYRQTTYTLSPDGGIVTSFPASDSLYVFYPEEGKRLAYFAGYSEPTNIKPMKLTRPEAGSIQYLENFNYGSIIYDRTEDVYYRLLRLPRKEYDPEKLRDEESKKPNAVIIFDGNFNIIGETILPDDTYYPLNTLVNSDGLHIQVESDDDDFLKFRVFKLKR